ncbi:MAG TPA: hypothetical protein VMT17_10500 [Anaeromyxobacteraceae bacterium]|nr:hypothetical protein [Anaeromyxobacteraceae bacterium]
MRQRVVIALVAAAFLAPAAGRASELDVYSNTQLNASQQWRNGQTYSTVPLYEFLSLSGRNIQIPGGDLQLVVDVWGGVDLANPPWWNGYDNTGNWSGDLNLAFVQGSWLGGDLKVRLGRMSVGYGNARMLQLDGGALTARIDNLVTIDVYAGAPTTQRFTAYGNIYSANPTVGNLAVGGRLGFAFEQWVNVGFSAAFAWDDGNATREDLALDLKVAPASWCYLMGYMDWSVFATDYFSGTGGQVADASANLVFPVAPHLQFTADYAYSIPALMLPYNSILWVFSDAVTQYLGGSVRVGLEAFKLKVPIDFDVGYRRTFENAIGSGTTGGNKLFGAVRWTPSQAATVGVEGSWLEVPSGYTWTGTNSGYGNARAFGSLKGYGLTGTLDFQGYWFTQPVNGNWSSVIGNATLGYEIGSGLSVVGAVSGGATPYYKDYFSGLVKIVYNQSYRSREVY